MTLDVLPRRREPPLEPAFGGGGRVTLGAMTFLGDEVVDSREIAGATMGSATGAGAASNGSSAAHVSLLTYKPKELTPVVCVLVDIHEIAAPVT